MTTRCSARITTRGLRVMAALAVASSIALAACTPGTHEESQLTEPATRSVAALGEEAPPAGTATPALGRTDPPADLAPAVSRTREDSVQPEFGDPLVDALHYDLALAWSPGSDHLEATERLTFRATADGIVIPLDLDDSLRVAWLTVDGEDVGYWHSGQDLLIEHPVTEGAQYVVELAYSGTPRAYPTDLDLPDFADGLGWVVTPEHETFTLPWPAGGFTWFALNDQPADRAFYDFRLTVPQPWTGIANGRLVSTAEADGFRTTTWHVAEPAYLVTVTFGDYDSEETESASGVPITVWFPSDDPDTTAAAAYAPEALVWLEERLGPYPFDTLTIVVFGLDFGMQTHTMVSLGEYASRALVVHELAHSWYGDAVSPADRSDAWMDEGWATYLHSMWEAEAAGIPLDQKMDDLATRLGNPSPPTAPGGDVYVRPALMLHELRKRVGKEAFFDLARRWPVEEHARAAGREEYWTWLEEQTDLELTGFLWEWLVGPRPVPDRR